MYINPEEELNKENSGTLQPFHYWEDNNDITAQNQEEVAIAEPVQNFGFKVNLSPYSGDIKDLNMGYQDKIEDLSIKADLITNNEETDVNVRVNYQNTFEVYEKADLSVNASTNYTGTNNNLETNFEASYVDSNGITATAQINQNGTEIIHSEKINYNHTFNTEHGNLTINTGANFSNKDDNLSSNAGITYAYDGLTINGKVTQDGKDFQHSESVAYSKTFNTKNGDFGVKASTTYSSEDDTLRSNLGVNYTDEGFNVNTSISQNGNEIEHSASVGYENTSENSSTELSVSEVNNNWTADIEHTDIYQGGTSSKVEAHYDKNNTHIGFGVSKPFNPDNINNTENQDEVRREELVEAQEKFSLQTEMGYANGGEDLLDNSSGIEVQCNKKGFYFDISALYRINDNNFLQGDYSNWENGCQARAVADLKPLKIEYAHIKNISEYMTKTNTVDVISKGDKFKYNVNFKNSVTNNPLATARYVTSISAGAIFNRNEWGSFNDGFNAEANGTIMLNNGKVNGYSARLDCAYNLYGFGDNENNDFLIRGELELNKNQIERDFDVRVSSAHRWNDCRSILEPSVSFGSNTVNEHTTEYLGAQIGFYQQIGKNIGDASVFVQTYVGRTWEENLNKTHYQTEIRLGGDLKVGKRTHLNLESNWNKSSGFGGNIGARVTF